MRILIATPLTPMQSGGPAQYAFGLAHAFIKDGHTVETLSFESVAQLPSGLRHFVLFFSACKSMRNADSVIVLDTVSMALPVVIAARLFRKKCIIRIGGDFLWEAYVERTKEQVLLSSFYLKERVYSHKERIIFWLQRKIILPLAHTLVFSTSWQRELWKEPYQLEKRCVVIIENAYSPLNSEENHTRATNETDLPTIVWIGREIFLKNTKTLDRAVALLKAQYPNVRYQKYSNLPHDDVRKILDTHCVLVVPSFSEVSPNIVLEALACGTPVLLTHDCGFNEVLKDAVSWIDPCSAEDIQKQLENLMTPNGYTSAHARARSFSKRRTYRDVAETFLSLLELQ